MPITIHIINPSQDIHSPEYFAAVRLKKLIEDSAPKQVNGHIQIAYSVTLCGQEVRDVDLVVAGNFENYILKKYYTNDIQFPKKDLAVEGFCIVIELKGHPQERIIFKGTHFYVEYCGQLKDATNQNENQRYSFKNYFKNECGYNPFVSNFIWFNNLSKNQLNNISSNPIGALPSEFTLKDMVDMCIKQGQKPYFVREEERYHLSPSKDDGNVFSDLAATLFCTKTPASGLTRKKIEVLLQDDVIKELKKYPFGKKLTIIEGRAGTGKTFKLIQAALSLATNETGKRCVILTYNHALVSDIRRTLHFMNIPDGIDSYTIQIYTVHSFFIKMMKTLNIETSHIFGSRFDEEYKQSLKELSETVKELMDEQDIKVLKKESKTVVDWDYILIDEGQDWPNNEKEILFKIYGPENIVVADGVDQFIRTHNRQHWDREVINIYKINQKYGLRQRSELMNIVNAIAQGLCLQWNVRPSNSANMIGGKLIVSKAYTKGLHKELIRHNKKSECDNYDILFLVPPTMVEKDDSGSHFKNIQHWEKNDIHIFDGTNSKLREQYPTNVEQCRMFQYDSCRGLEGWIVVCLNFDELIEYKLKEAEHIDFSDNIAFESKSEAIKKYAYTWAMMPLNRAIDTLVITLKNPDSEIGKILKTICSNFKDNTEWRLT